MATKIKKNFFYFFFVATAIFYIGDCRSDAAIDDVMGTRQCYNIGGHEVCYFIGSEHLSEWHLAHEVCGRKASTLPIIRNEDEQNVLEKYLKYLQLKRPRISFVWTAGKRENVNDWVWINGQPVSDKRKQIEEIKYKKWGRNVFTTSGDICIHVEAFSGFWIKTECSKKHSIICQIKGSTRIATTVTNATTATTATIATTAATGDTNAWNKSKGPQSRSISLLTFVLSIAGVILVCIVLSAIVGIIAARKALAKKNLERDLCRSTSAVFSHDYCDMQLQPVHEDLYEMKY